MCIWVDKMIKKPFCHWIFVKLLNKCLKRKWIILVKYSIFGDWLDKCQIAIGYMKDNYENWWMNLTVQFPPSFDLHSLNEYVLNSNKYSLWIIPQLPKICIFGHPHRGNKIQVNAFLPISLHSGFPHQIESMRAMNLF